MSPPRLPSGSRHAAIPRPTSKGPGGKAMSNSPRSEFAQGARRSLSIALACAPFGLMIGAAAVSQGLAPLEVIMMSVLVFAGAAQFAAIDLWTEPLPVTTIVLTVAVLNIRHVLMGPAMRPILLPAGPVRASALVFFLTDETWAVTLDTARRRPVGAAFYAGLVLFFYSVWVASTALGTLLSRFIEDPASLGLDFMLVAVFTVLILGRWSGRRDLAPWLASAGVALLVYLVLPGKWYVIAGAIAGAATAAALHREPVGEAG